MTNKNLTEAKSALLKKWLRGQVNSHTITIPRRPLNSPIPLSFPQQRQLFLELLEPGTAVNNLSVLLELKGKLELAALEQSANQIIARHDVLRTCFSFSEGLPTPEVLSYSKITIPIIDLQEIDFIEQETEARRLAEKDVLQPFDLTQAPLIRLKLYELSKEYYLLLVIVHHTIADGWSLGVFLRELIMLYQKNTFGTYLLLPELTTQYADYACWQTETQNEDLLQSSINYWKKQLSGELPVLELPTDQQRGARQTFSGGTHRFVLSAKVTEALEKLSQQEDVTLFMTLLTAFYILLHRYTGQDDLLVGTPVANRSLPEIENLIGVFINTIVLRTSLAGDPSFRELIRRVRETSSQAYAHQDLPFEKLVEELKPKRDLSRTPIFQVVFNLQNSPMPKLETPGLRIVPLEIDRGVSQFELTLMMTKSERQYRCTVEYNRDLFTPGTVNRMFRSFQLVLEHAIINPDCTVSGLRIVPEEELHHIIHGANQTQITFPREKCLHQVFEEQVQQTPNAIAVIHNGTSITYHELNNRANLLAGHLQLLGIKPEIRVGIFMEKSLSIVEALLGVLKAGGTYVPIDTSFPAERVKFILEDANVPVLITNVDTGLLGVTKVHIVNLNDEQFSTISDCSNPQTNVSPGNLAYVIYTSGSTGQPKGVMVPHSALINFLWSMRTQPGINKNDVLLSVTSISFDIVALELFLPLIVGATVIIAGKEITNNPLLIDQEISSHQVNMMQATPATWQILIGSGWSGNPELKALCGGDVLARKLANQLLDHVESLWNMYGPTETTVWSSVNQIEKGDDAITIGKPIANTQIYILDRYMQPVPIGVAGELHIGGEGLAMGYLNQTHLTKEKFITDCFSSKPGTRLYKTGDRARYLKDYSIEILGRTDDQVKIHGHRIELGEIASVMMQHPSVHEAIVIARIDNSVDQRLVAYYTAKPDQLCEANEIQEFLRKKLPGYMIPASLVQLDKLPLSPSGKIDRRSLPVTEFVRQLPGYIAPRNEVEQILADIWQNVLDVEMVGINDNFFDLGGASMQSLQIVAKANMYGLRISVENIFEYQSIAELVAHLKLSSQ